MSDKYILIVNFRRLCKENMETLLSASALGYKVALMAKSLPEQFAPYVDKFYKTDTGCEDAVFTAAHIIFSELDVKGILPSSETNVALVSKLCEFYKLPGMPTASIDNSRSKTAMREAGKNNPAVVLKNRTITRYDELEDAADYVGFPLIIKPAMGMGSIGIFTLFSKDELGYFGDHFKAVAINDSNDLAFIVEEYIDGQEVCIDGIISNGHITVYGIGDKWTTDKHHLEYYEIFPSNLPADQQQQTIESVKSILKDFGFDNCTFHMEGKVSDSGFKMIEVGARPGGDHWISHILRTVTGINGYQEAIKVCVGEESKPEVKYNGYAAIRYLLADKAGTLKAYKNWDVAANIPEVEYMIPEVLVGTEINLPPECYRTQKLINIMARSNNYKRLQEVVDRAVDIIEPIIE